MKRIYIFLLLPLLAGCYATHKTSKAYDSSYSSYAAESQQGLDMLIRNQQGVVQQESQAQENRMVVYDATLSLVVKRSDSINKKLTLIAEKFEGYSVTLGNRRSVIRVKSEKLNVAIEEIAGLGKVKWKAISGDDVTDVYTDYQVRLDNAQNARKRYLQLLEKAENVEAALKVEKELERLNGEIDLLKGKLNRLKHLEAFSTITINIEEKVKPGILGYIGIGLYHSVKWLFVRN